MTNVEIFNAAAKELKHRMTGYPNVVYTSSVAVYMRAYGFCGTIADR